MNNVEHRYRYDATFNRVVDQLRDLLSSYLITPSELRGACILAATMHESQNIRPLLRNKTAEEWYPSSVTNPFTGHVFGAEQGSGTFKFRVCKRCGLSNVYLQGNTDDCKGVLKLR